MILTGKLVLYTRILVLCILLALSAVLWCFSLIVGAPGTPRVSIDDNLIRDGFCESPEECNDLLFCTTTGRSVWPTIVGHRCYEVVGENERVFSAIVGYYAIAASSGGHRGGRIRISAYRETHDEYLESYRRDDRRRPEPFLTLEIKE